MLKTGIGHGVSQGQRLLYGHAFGELVFLGEYCVAVR